MSAAPVVHVVDDDPAVRSSLVMLVRSAGLEAQAHDSAAAFLERYRPGDAGCLITDLRMPGLDGLELQERLHELGAVLPVIVLTGYGDVPAAVRAMKAGALDFVQKPFEPDELLDRVREALRRDADERSRRLQAEEASRRLARLTPREREVLERVVAGQANKVIAIDLGISERTVELHRARVMRKMGARSLPELTRLAGLAGGAPRGEPAA